ncbi:hypothetical protein L2Y96_20340 [Luteibacter aegosomaticola]|uniref:hypothetical protein n=1 Tax=Luteibacter aegosomaticola TaxID=2911538 RepID=UPI001FF997A6|nr:hypothetical protein [Luteibacter aegosomaticola]UPG89710.1 hypothetical protein L2Y96_20340 [Luteibacter aegosomaticola]
MLNASLCHLATPAPHGHKSATLPGFKKVDFSKLPIGHAFFNGGFLDDASPKIATQAANTTAIIGEDGGSPAVLLICQEDGGVIFNFGFPVKGAVFTYKNNDRYAVTISVVNGGSMTLVEFVIPGGESANIPVTKESMGPGFTPSPVIVVIFGKQPAALTLTGIQYES